MPSTPMPVQTDPFETAVVGFLASRVMRADTWRMVPTRANGQPAVVVYLRAAEERAADTAYTPYGVQVLTLIGARISRITSFNDPGLVSAFAPARAASTTFVHPRTPAAGPLCWGAGTARRRAYGHQGHHG